MRGLFLTLIVLIALPSVTQAQTLAEPAAPPARAAQQITALVQAAIVTAVQERMGAGADVTVVGLEVTDARPMAVLRAVPEPNARTGERIHFRLVGSDARGGRAETAGRAVAFVRVDVEHVRARTLVERGRELRDEDIELSHGEIGSLPLRRLPNQGEVAGSRALVNLAPGEVITKPSVSSRPAVRSGQVVKAIARVGAVEVVAALTAAQDGVEGAVIRVVNKESRRELKARIVEPGVVEVSQ